MLTANSTYTLSTGVSINRFFLHDNNPNKISLPSVRTKDLLGITIHNTNDLANVEDDAEQYTRATYNGNMGTVRTHFYVDDLGGWQNMDLIYQNWTNGDGTGPGNAQTIAIECIMSSSNASDSDSVKARTNTAKLTAYLLDMFGLTIADIYTHTHWLHTADGTSGTRAELNVKSHSYKTCPLYIIPNWNDFLAEVSSYLGGSGDNYTEVDEGNSTSSENNYTSSITNYKVAVVDPDPNGLNIRELPSFNSDITCTASKGVYTIVEETTVDGNTFGRLKSGSGWVIIKAGFCVKV